VNWKVPTQLVKVVCLALGCLAFLGLRATIVSADVTVGTCLGASHYNTIQDGVTAAESGGGGKVSVCPGTYPEQVTITSQLRLEGIQNAGQNAVIIVPPATGLVANAPDLNNGPTPNTVAAQVYVSNVTQGSVTITNVTVDGTGNGLTSGCGTDLAGILYQNSSGTIENVTARNQKLGDALGGCQDGIGIWVQSGATKAQVTIQNSSIHDYQANGIQTDNNETDATVRNNSVIGSIPNDMIAQNGIQISFGATARVQDNFVINDVFVNPPGATTIFAASGILVYAAPNVQVRRNHIGNVQEGIALVTDPTGLGTADNGQANKNTISAISLGDAVDLCSNHDQANNNIIFEANGESALHFDASCGGGGVAPTGNHNHANGNSINEAAVGVLTDLGASQNQTTNNDFFNVVKISDPSPSKDLQVHPHY
jgi:hypothetical protein